MSTRSRSHSAAQTPTVSSRGPRRRGSKNERRARAPVWRAHAQRRARRPGRPPSKAAMRIGSRLIELTALQPDRDGPRRAARGGSPAFKLTRDGVPGASGIYSISVDNIAVHDRMRPIQWEPPMGGSVEPLRVSGVMVPAAAGSGRGAAACCAARRSVRVRPGAATKRRAHRFRTPRITSPRASNDQRTAANSAAALREARGSKERAGRGGRCSALRKTAHKSPSLCNFAVFTASGCRAD
jgi:hypothetical protein